MEIPIWESFPYEVTQTTCFLKNFQAFLTFYLTLGGYSSFKYKNYVVQKRTQVK